jgi:hypothetical protein
MMRGCSETTPDVMLSPKATNLVFERFCDTVIRTPNPHEAFTFAESVAVHFTEDSPTGNTSPDFGAHSTT